MFRVYLTFIAFLKNSVRSRKRDQDDATDACGRVPYILHTWDANHDAHRTPLPDGSSPELSGE